MNVGESLKFCLYMEANEEALRAKEIAELKFAARDFLGAKSYALKAKALYPKLEGISQMVATFDVYIASEIESNGEICYYSVLGLKPSAGKIELKRQYKRMAMLLHPDKNKSIGADGAFRLISEAWDFLSDELKKSSFYYKRKKRMASTDFQTNSSGNGCYPSTTSERLDTFWTVCKSCKVQYEYLRKYVNKRLSCKNCQGVFIAVEMKSAPFGNRLRYGPACFSSGNDYGNKVYNGVASLPSNSTYHISQYFGRKYEYETNVSCEWSSISGISSGNMDSKGVSIISNDYACLATQGNARRGRPKTKHRSGGTSLMENTSAKVLDFSASEGSACIASKPNKKRKVLTRPSFTKGSVENGLKCHSESGTMSPSARIEQKCKITSHPTKRYSNPPAFDTCKLLIGKARTHIQKKLEEISLASQAAASKVLEHGTTLDGGAENKNSVVRGHKPEGNRKGLVSITVPDPDFHDFDKDRSEECFKPKQIWAIYDEDDGMPRLYCRIREVLSIQPFKIHITYLSSNTNTEFGSVIWVDYGFTKSCGCFRAQSSEIIEQVNIFSHLLKGEKTGRGGCVRIFPKSGDIWAVYRNWSPDWNQSTPDELRHQYDMVEIMDDYSEELGVFGSPLIKLEGFKTLYRRNTSKDARIWIPREEMLRFSHQVPSWFLKEEGNLPSNCWDLDPAATPDEWLNGGT